MEKVRRETGFTRIASLPYQKARGPEQQHPADNSSKDKLRGGLLSGVILQHPADLQGHLENRPCSDSQEKHGENGRGCEAAYPGAEDCRRPGYAAQKDQGSEWGLLAKQRRHHAKTLGYVLDDESDNEELPQGQFPEIIRCADSQALAKIVKTNASRDDIRDRISTAACSCRLG